MKRIAYVVHSLNLGGAERLAADMALALNQEFDIQVLCLDEPGLWAQTLRNKNIAVHCLYRQPGLDLRIPYLLAKFARQNKIDLWHAHQCTPWFYAGISRLLYFKPKLLFEEHGRHYPEQKNKKRSLINRIVLQPLSSDIVAVSRDIKQRLVDYEGLSAGKIKVVYNGTYLPQELSAEDRSSARKKLGIADDDFLLGTVGRFDPIKNLPLALNAFKNLQKEHKKLKLALIGDGPEYENIYQLSKQMGLNGSVLMPGYQDDPQNWTALLDCFFLCSFSEGTSMALLGSMAAKVPAIVTDVGGNPELVQDGQTGWVIPSNDARAFAQAIQDAVSNPDELHKRGQAAKKRFQSNFTFQNMLNSYRQLYSSLMFT